MKKIIMAAAFISLTACKYTESPSASLAKEMCSCLYVVEQSVEYCKMVTKESRILAKWEANDTEKEVLSKGVSFTSVARLSDDPRFGCTIVSIKDAPENAKEFN